MNTEMNSSTDIRMTDVSVFGRRESSEALVRSLRLCPIKKW